MPIKNYNDKRSISPILVMMSLILIVFVAISGYLFTQNRELKSKKDEAVALKTKVSKLLLNLPNETPVIGTVNDKDKFKDQPFFNQVENGDKILIFTEAKKAVIYREKNNQLINVGPIAVTSEKSK